MAANANLAAFESAVNRPEHEISLALAGLTMSAFEYPDLAVSHYVDRFEQLSQIAHESIQDKDEPAVALATVLFDDMGFSGNTQDYGDPRNSFLSEVLDRRMGIPITLSVVYLEIAQRLGFRAKGVGLPGHFIVGVYASDDAQVQPIYLDPFHRGQVLSVEDCKARVRAITADKLPFNSSFLNPVSKRYILTRILNNLKGTYGSMQDLVRTAHVVERLLVLDPNDSGEVRNLAMLYGATGRQRMAIETFERYLTAWPDASDHQAIKSYMKKLAANLARLN